MRPTTRLLALLAVPLLCTGAAFTQQTTELGVPGPVLTPIQHKPYWRLERERFGYQPRFQPGVTTFDLENHPYMRAGKVIQTLDERGRWQQIDLEAAVRAAYPDWDGTFSTGPFAEEHVVFDDDGDIYTIVNATRSPIGQALLLHSADAGANWRVYPLGAGMTRLERPDGHNQFTYPPPILIWFGPNKEHLRLIVPKKLFDGTLDVSTVVDVCDDSILVPSHSGGGNALCSLGDSIHIVWPGRTQIEGHVGTPEYAATYSRTAGTLSEPVLLGFGGTDPEPNAHNLPAIAADSGGYLHVVLGAHHDPFRYARSLEPNSIAGGWTEPVEFGAPKLTPGEGSYTYTGWVCDQNDTLHCVARWAGEGYYFRLTYLRKPKDGNWEVRPHLVIPFGGNYSVYYHKLTVDRRGRLFCSYVYTRAARFDDEIAAHTKKNPAEDPNLDFINKEPCLLVSYDGGDEWRLAVTPDLRPDAVARHVLQTLASAALDAAPDADTPPEPTVPPVVPAETETAAPLPESEVRLPATLLRQLGGGFYPVAVEGNLACVGVGKSVVLLDIADPAAIRVIGQSSPLGDAVQDLRIRLPYLFVSAWRDGFAVYDISDPASPHLVAHDQSTEGRHFTLVDNTVYLPAAGDGLRIIDISAPSTPTELGRVTGIEAYDVEVLGQWAYVATGTQGMKIINIADPSAPAAVRDLFAPSDHADRVNTSWDVTRDGASLYVSPGPSPVPLRIFDLADPGNPAEVSTIGDVKWGWGRKVAVRDGLLAFAGLDGMHLIDVGDPAQPREIASTTDRIVAVAFGGSHVYATGGGGLTAYNLADPAGPQAVGRYEAPKLPTSIAVAGTRAYVADWNAGLRVFDVTDPNLPKPLGLYGGEEWALGVAADEHYVYVAARGEGMVVLDAADPANLVPVGSFPSETGVRDVAVAGHFAYLAEAGVGVRVVDVADPAQPRLVGVAELDQEVLGLDAADGRLYIALAQLVTGGLRVCDIGDDGRLRHIGRYGCDSDVWDVEVSGNRAWLATAADGLQVLDVSDPRDPIYIGRVDVAGSVWGVAGDGHPFYLPLGRDGLGVVELGAPSAD